MLVFYHNWRGTKHTVISWLPPHPPNARAWKRSVLPKQPGCSTERRLRWKLTNQADFYTFQGSYAAREGCFFDKCGAESLHCWQSWQAQGETTCWWRWEGKASKKQQLYWKCETPRSAKWLQIRGGRVGKGGNTEAGCSALLEARHLLRSYTCSVRQSVRMRKHRQCRTRSESFANTSHKRLLEMSNSDRWRVILRLTWRQLAPSQNNPASFSKECELMRRRVAHACDSTAAEDPGGWVLHNTGSTYWRHSDGGCMGERHATALLRKLGAACDGALVSVWLALNVAAKVECIKLDRDLNQKTPRHGIRDARKVNVGYDLRTTGNAEYSTGSWSEDKQPEDVALRERQFFSSKRWWRAIEANAETHRLTKMRQTSSTTMLSA